MFFVRLPRRRVQFPLNVLWPVVETQRNRLRNVKKKPLRAVASTHPWGHDEPFLLAIDGNFV